MPYSGDDAAVNSRSELVKPNAANSRSNLVSANANDTPNVNNTSADDTTITYLHNQSVDDEGMREFSLQTSSQTNLVDTNDDACVVNNAVSENKCLNDSYHRHCVPPVK